MVSEEKNKTIPHYDYEDSNSPLVNSKKSEGEKRRTSSYWMMKPWHRLKTSRVTDPVCQRDNTLLHTLLLLLLLGNSSRSRLEFLPDALEVGNLHRKRVLADFGFAVKATQSTAQCL